MKKSNNNKSGSYSGDGKKISKIENSFEWLVENLYIYLYAVVDL